MEIYKKKENKIHLIIFMLAVLVLFINITALIIGIFQLDLNTHTIIDFSDDINEDIEYGNNIVGNNIDTCEYLKFFNKE